MTSHPFSNKRWKNLGFRMKTSRVPGVPIAHQQSRYHTLWLRSKLSSPILSNGLPLNNALLNIYFVIGCVRKNLKFDL